VQRGSVTGQPVPWLDAALHRCRKFRVKGEMPSSLSKLQNSDE
jgi:hypothetical protein